MKMGILTRKGSVSVNIHTKIKWNAHEKWIKGVI